MSDIELIAESYLLLNKFVELYEAMDAMKEHYGMDGFKKIAKAAMQIGGKGEVDLSKL